MTRVVKKPLPPSAVPDPERARIKTRSDHAQRATAALIALLIIAAGIAFVADYTGHTTSTTVNVTDTIPQNCSIDLAPGLNVISMNCISNNQDRDEVLNRTDTAALAAIYEYRNEQSDQWRVYNPDLPSYVVNDLKTFSRLKGYLIYVKSGQNTIIDYKGFIASSSSIPLLADNNLVGYPSRKVDTLPEALTTINDTFTRVRTYNGSAWVEFNRTHNSTGGLANLTPEEGYWITMSASDNWEVSYNRT